MKIRNLAMATAGLLYLSAAAFAQITAIEGVVKGADGAPVKDALIQIDRTDIKGHYKVKTDKKGHYIYNGLPMGTYDIACLIDGKQADQVKGVRTSPGDPQPVNFDLRQAAAAASAKQAAMQQAVASGQISKDLERGLTAEQKKQLEESMKKQEAAMKKNAALNQAFGDGKTALDNKQYDVAVDNLTKASEIDPNQLAVWSNLAEAYKGLASTKTGPDADAAMQKCLDAYAKALAVKPDDAGIHNNYALALAKAKKFPEAQAELENAAKLDPPQAGKYYYNLGALEVNGGQSDAALEAFKKAIECTPPYLDAYYQYGVLLVAQAKIVDGKITPVPGTAEAFQKYLELAPTGQWAQSAKDMLATLGSSISTGYQNPSAPKKKK
ncbi:MAG: carboxypeptidase regulatory-like domain-containing protein [Bryobacteraceae bacterium]|jgi:tetratricopeptide (TPR) repeat protein